MVIDLFESTMLKSFDRGLTVKLLPTLVVLKLNKSQFVISEQLVRKMTGIRSGNSTSLGLSELTETTEKYRHFTTTATDSTTITFSFTGLQLLITLSYSLIFQFFGDLATVI